VGFDPKTRTSKTYARRLFPKQHYERAIRRLCDKHGLEPFGPGHMRHALATYAKTRGMSNAQIAKMLGHTDGGRLVETTYADPAAQIDSPLASERPRWLAKPKRLRRTPMTCSRPRRGSPFCDA
jgi:integrase